jgi:polyisoprenoid-binding protein YceI
VLEPVDPVGNSKRTKESRKVNTTVTQIKSGTYTLDPIHSSFGFAVKQSSVSTFKGHFENVDATLEDGVLTGVAQVESVKTAVAQLKEHLLGPDFFNAAESPTISFRSTEITLGADDSAEVHGDLTMRGVTNPVTARGIYGTAKNMRGSEVLGFDLEATVDRRDYGLSWQASLPSGGDALGWDVTLEVHLALVGE